MSSSVARLAVAGGEHGARIERAYAEAPLRWTTAGRTCDGWAEVSQQLVGDGVLGGDSSRVTIRVSPGANLLVRGVAVTPLRGPGTSRTATLLKVASGGSLIHVPGALVPHAGSAHQSSLRIEAESGARVFAAQMLVPGRSGMGEIGQFRRLRLRTSALYSGQVALFEDAEIAREGIAGRSVFGAASAYVSILLLGCDDDDAIALPGGSNTNHSLVASNSLRHGGLAIRGLFATLGDAQNLVAGMADTARARWRQKAACSDHFGLQLVY